MPGRVTEKARLGSIAYINSLPVDLGILCGAVHCGAELVQDVPARLNEMLLAGELDLSPVSAFWYAAHADRFILLPDLSISSESGVQSVLLFSKRPPNELKGVEIAVTTQGRTTPVLLDILCQKKYGFKPRTRSGPAGTAEAVLLIGDEALQARQAYTGNGWTVTDLAEEWRSWTGKPFVFAVWAARRAFYAEEPEKLRNIHRALLKSKQWGIAHPAKVIATARGRSGLGDDVLVSYFSRLNHDFGAPLREGLLLYLEHCRALGHLSAVPELESINEKNAELTAGPAL